MEYIDYNDYELIDFIAEGNEEANNIIIEKYTPLINSIANKMMKYCKNNGIDYNDLKQEGFIGLNDAITHFSDRKNVLFYTYAKKCIERRIVSSLVSASRLKYKALNDSISFDDESNFLDKMLKDDSNNPELIIENNEIEEKLIKDIKKRLTDYEEQVFELMLSNFSYREIADILDKNPKAIDNAIQRIRLKVKEALKK